MCADSIEDQYRLTGRTTRMLYEALKSLKSGSDVVIVCYGNIRAGEIKEKFKYNFNHWTLDSGNSSNIMIKSERHYDIEFKVIEGNKVYYPVIEFISDIDPRYCIETNKLLGKSNIDIYRDHTILWKRYQNIIEEYHRYDKVWI